MPNGFDNPYLTQEEGTPFDINALIQYITGVESQHGDTWLGTGQGWNVEYDPQYGTQELGFNVQFHRERNTGKQELGEVNVITLDGECETLVLRKYRRTKKNYEDDNLSFDFCKTRMYQYDIAVKQLLCHCHSLLGEDFTWSHD